MAASSRRRKFHNLFPLFVERGEPSGERRRAMYNWDYQSRTARLSTIGSDSVARGQNWTVEIIATSADALAVNPRLWPSVTANLAPYATAVSYRSAMRRGATSGWRRRRRRWRGKFRLSLASVFSIPSCLLPGKYRKLTYHQQIITRYRNHHYAATLPPSPLPSSSSIVFRGEKFLSRPETSGA